MDPNHRGLGPYRMWCSRGSLDLTGSGHITALLKHIEPAVDKETSILTNRTSKNKDFVDKVLWHNVEYQIQTILDQSDILKDMYYQYQINIVGAVYDIKTGTVLFDEKIADHIRNKSMVGIA
ncbi:MAG: hypothetical protein IPO69_02470 [Saprospiraceae bacterium]|nr:hypothetical protein [Saprospiraceae bacterium]